MSKTNFMTAFHAHARMPHPHLHPVNRATLHADSALAVAKAKGLMAYQQYLAAAREVKARRAGVSASFERTVLAQAVQAQGDLQALCGAALRVTQQINQTDFWGQIFTHVGATLDKAGPQHLGQLWSEALQTIQKHDSAQVFAKAGLSSDLTDAITSVMANVDATLAKKNGTLTVQTTVPGNKEPSAVSLLAPGRPVTGVTDLLRAQQFDSIVSVFTNNEPAYLDVVPVPGVAGYEPADLTAVASILARQRLADHVRKLQDTGLATYQGQDPVSFIIGLIVGSLLVAAVAAVVLAGCDPQPPPQPGEVVGSPDYPDVVCFAAMLLLTWALGALGAGLLLVVGAVGGLTGFVLGLVALAAFSVLLVDWVNHMPRFSPAPLSPTPPPPSG